MNALKQWLCKRGWHKTKEIRVLCGGEGPDDAASEIACVWCGKTGWRYCDGYESVT